MPDQQRDVVAVGLIYVIFCLLEPRAPQIELMYTFAAAPVFLGKRFPTQFIRLELQNRQNN
jgi:hypothetical protein